MQNNLIKFISILVINFLIFQNIMANEQFNFEISEIEILEDGSKIQGIKRGKITANDGVTIESDNFIYDKTQNILEASGNIVIKDQVSGFKTQAVSRLRLSNKEWDIKENIVSSKDGEKIEFACSSKHKISLTEGINSRYYSNKEKVVVIELIIFAEGEIKIKYMF